MAFGAYKRFSLLFFGGVAKGFEKSFKSIGPQLRGAGIHMLLRSYIAVMLMTTLLVLAASIAGVLAFTYLFPVDIVMFIYLVMFVPVLSASFAFMLLYIYPSSRYKKARSSIEANLPFALIHMDSISSSGIPIEFMFELVGNLKEYGEVSRQARLVVRNIKTFGMSSLAAINDVASKTPSPAFKQVLTGISSTISKGGNLSGFLKEMTSKSLFEYRLKREKYVKTLSTYADIYTAVLIAVPLMMLTVLVMMNILGGDVLGMTIPGAIQLMTFVVVPALNIAFLAFIHMRHPGN